MAGSTTPYHRLPGTASNALEQLRLYLGSDHLLLVASNGFTESYRRFYFSDIQSIRVKKTSNGLIMNGILGLFVAVLGLIGSGADGVTQGVIFSLAGFLLALLVLNTVWGPTCVCEIQTAVQTRRLPPLGRLRRARKVIARLKPLIESAQETVPPGELSRRIDALRQGTALGSESAGGVSPIAEGPGEPGPA